jgi:urea transporter
MGALLYSINLLIHLLISHCIEQMKICKLVMPFTLDTQQTCCAQDLLCSLRTKWLPRASSHLSPFMFWVKT